MILITSSLFVVLSYIYIWLPYSAFREKSVEVEFNRKVALFKLITVRRYYTPLKKLSFEEIQEKYNVDHIYDMIGRV